MPIDFYAEEVHKARNHAGTGPISYTYLSSITCRWIVNELVAMTWRVLRG
jgi:hypothetical protein